MLHKRNGLRLSDHFFEGEPSIDNYERTQQSFSYQFEHRFNDVFTARQNFRYQIPTCRWTRCTPPAGQMLTATC
jgi:iron complex outermembrane receptor protein